MPPNEVWGTHHMSVFRKTVRALNLAGQHVFPPAVIATGVLLAIRSLIHGDVVEGLGELAMGAALIAAIEIMWRRAGDFGREDR